MSEVLYNPINSRLVRSYLDHGDNLPKARTLHNVIGVTDRCDLSYAVIAADASIDLARRDHKSPEFQILSAEVKLGRVVEHARASLIRSELRNEVADIAVSASLRLGEIDEWRAAVKGQKIERDYDRFLLYCFEASQISAHGQGSEPILNEAIPKLLGLRAYRRAAFEKGWMSRLSLSREDNRFAVSMKSNNNWDLGIVKSTEPEDFINPATKVQIKKTYYRSDEEKYSKGGVTLLTADRAGFSDPARIILSCLEERFEGSVDDRDYGSVMDSEWLDDKTRLIQLAIAGNSK